jgi:hypothetical protein
LRERGIQTLKESRTISGPHPPRRLPCRDRAGLDEGVLRRQACRRCRTRATITGDHGAPVAAIRLTMNALSSAGGKVTATILQAGIG